MELFGQDRYTMTADAAEAAQQVRRLLAEVKAGRLTAPPGLLERLDGAATAFELVARPKRRRRGANQEGSA